MWFGLTHALYSITMTIGSAFKGLFENESARERGIDRTRNGENPVNTYYDRKGVERDIKTNQYRVRQVVNGDKVMTDPKGNIVYNFDEERRRKRVAEDLAEGKRYALYMYESEVRDHPDLPQISGDYLLDSETGRLVVKRRNVIEWSREKEISPGNTDWWSKISFGLEFYMDVYTGKILDETEFSRKFRNEHYEDILPDDLLDQWVSFMNDHRTEVPKKWNPYFYRPTMRVRDYCDGRQTLSLSWIKDEEGMRNEFEWKGKL